jgi:phenylacetate-coenzyme A ligase PaaK-like adenylate-forming protein
MQATSGSTGTPRAIGVSQPFLRYREGHEWLHIRMTGAERRARVQVAASLPSIWPVRRLVAWSRLGVPIDRWFAPGGADAKYRWLTRAMVEGVRVLGARLHAPTRLPLNDFRPVAAALSEFREQGHPAHVRTVVSMASRIASAALEGGFDISGTLFSVSGEALTPAKRALIEGTGASVHTFYGAVDFGTVGYACNRMKGDAVHLLDDMLIAMSYRLPDRPQPSLFISNQLLCGPRILINVGIDDGATIEPARCDCEYQRLGFERQAHDIFSYGKVTSQGMTIDAADLVDLIERILPAKFGGAPGDYQLAEIERNAQSEIVLRISPRAKAANPELVGQFAIAQLSKVRGGSLSERLWRFTDAMRVVVEEPETTSTGKVHAVRLRGG